MSVQNDDPATMQVTSVRLSEATIERLERHAPTRRHGRSELIREAIEDLLDRLDQQEHPAA